MVNKADLRLFPLYCKLSIDPAIVWPSIGGSPAVVSDIEFIGLANIINTRGITGNTSISAIGPDFNNVVVTLIKISGIEGDGAPTVFCPYLHNSDIVPVHVKMCDGIVNAFPPEFEGAYPHG